MKEKKPKDHLEMAKNAFKIAKQAFSEAIEGEPVSSVPSLATSCVAGMGLAAIGPMAAAIYGNMNKEKDGNGDKE